jgi:hypothetical protein
LPSSPITEKTTTSKAKTKALNSDTNGIATAIPNSIANDFINLPKHYHTITTQLFQAPQMLGEIGKDGSILLDARYLKGEWVKYVIQQKTEGASLVLVKHINTNNMTFEKFMKNFSNNRNTLKLSPERLKGVGTHKYPPSQKYTTTMPQFMQEIANASASTLPFSNGGHLWSPLEFGMSRTTIGRFFGTLLPKSGLQELWLGTFDACITQAKSDTVLHHEDCDTICSSNPLDCMFHWTAAMIIAHKNGSPIHVDTLCWPWRRKTSFVDAFGYVLQGPKAMWVAKRQVATLKTIGKWATKYNLAGKTPSSRTYASHFVDGTAPHPFQSKHSLAWPTVGQWADLENTYDIPNQWHLMDEGSLYFLFAKAPHSVLNESSRCTVPIAKDELFTPKM